MIESILLISCFALFMYIGIREYKFKNNKERHEWWLSEVKECMHNIECEFRHKCEKITEEEFSKQIFDEYRYSVRIRELEKAYKKDPTDRVIALKRVHVTTVPDHLVREYERNITNIADTFCYFGNLHQ